MWKSFVNCEVMGPSAGLGSGMWIRFCPGWKGVQSGLGRLQKKLIRAKALEISAPGVLGGSAVEGLPLAQDMIPGSWDGVPHGIPCMEPASPSACRGLSLSVCVSHE